MKKTTDQKPISAQTVAQAFIQQYYQIMCRNPALVYQFYQDISKLGRPEEDGSMSVTTTLQAINKKIISLDKTYRTEIKSINGQDSVGGGVHVLVTGNQTGKNKITRYFTQTFFLTKIDEGYFVQNDMFQYVDDVNLKYALINDDKSPVKSEPVNTAIEDQVSSEDIWEDIAEEVKKDLPANDDVPVVEKEVNQSSCTVM